ncbi:MAG: DUF2905 domain-containing protein [Nitriliruptorales bacterium]
MNRSIGLLVVLLGVGAIVVGVLIMTGAFSWFGRLPGDIRIETDSSRIYIPLVSMIVVSIVLTVLLNLLGRWL